MSASGDVRGRVDQTKLASDEAYTLVVCRRSEIIPANPHLAFWVQATWEQPERAFMDSVGHPVTATPVDVVAALSLLEGRYTLTNEAAPSVLCWLWDAPISDATTLRVADAFTIPPRPDDGWCASIELNDGGTIYVQSKQANADGRIVVADGKPWRGCYSVAMRTAKAGAPSGLSRIPSVTPARRIMLRLRHCAKPMRGIVRTPGGSRNTM